MQLRRLLIRLFCRFFFRLLLRFGFAVRGFRLLLRFGFAVRRLRLLLGRQFARIHDHRLFRIFDDRKLRFVIAIRFAVRGFRLSVRHLLRFFAVLRGFRFQRRNRRLRQFRRLRRFRR